MLDKYLDFINENFNITEGYVNHPSVVYWSENADSLLNDNWFDISVNRYSPPVYIIKFRVGDNDKDQYNYYNVVIEKGTTDTYYMENPEPFIEKFKTEFLKHPLDYIDNMKYDPKALGDLGHIRNSSKFNL